MSARHMRNSTCLTSTCGSVCSDNTCSRYIPTGRYFWSKAKSQPLSLRTICPMFFGLPQEARTDASMSEPSRLCADAMLSCCLTSEQPMRGERNSQCSNPSVEVSLSVHCWKIWRRTNSAVRDSILPTFCLLFRLGVRYSGRRLPAIHIYSNSLTSWAWSWSRNNDWTARCPGEFGL